MVRRDVGSGRDLHDPGVVADPLRDLCAHLRGDAAIRVRRLHARLPRRRREPCRRIVTAPDKYVYTPWIGSVWYPPPYTYGLAAAPIYNPYVGFTYGFALGLATAAWTEPYWGGAYYHPGYWGAYPCCATASANVYGHCGATTYRERAWYAGGGVAGVTVSGSYSNSRTGTWARRGGRQFNANTGNADARLRPDNERRRRGPGNVARAGNYNVSRGSAPRARPSLARAPVAARTAQRGDDSGAEGERYAGEGSTNKAETGQTNSGRRRAGLGNNDDADVNGNVYENKAAAGRSIRRADGAGRRRHSSADREAQARSAGAGGRAVSEAVRRPASAAEAPAAAVRRAALRSAAEDLAAAGRWWWVGGASARRHRRVGRFGRIWRRRR